MDKRLFFVAYGLSIFGTGLVYPLTAIFLYEDVGLDASQVSLYFAIAAVSGLVVNPLAGIWCDRQGPYRVAGVAAVSQMLGPLVLVMADSVTQVWTAAVFTGVGSGAFFAVQTPLIASLFGRPTIGQIYSQQYIIMNAASGVAGILSGWAVGQWDGVAYRAAFAYNALSFLIYAVIVLWFIAAKRGFPRLADAEQPNIAGAANDREATGRPASSSRPWHPYLDRRFLPLLGAQLVISGFAFAQMDGVLPVVFREVGQLPVIVVGVFLTVNGVAVVLLQSLISRLAEAFGHVKSLRIMFVIWGVSFAIGAASMVFSMPPPVRIALVMVFAVVFAVGECFLSPSFQPLVAECSPTHSLGSYAAAASLVYSLGLAVGPVVMLPLFDKRELFWGGLFLAMALGLVVLQAFRPRATATSRLEERQVSVL